ncbi:hypothetical protein F4779DRAFT_632839 [Xylariaceae sp. FL0662B]|nr:hypothetical protein F4779DRAFT_632839 [Xylariaceae sp. FL0662B]
MGERPLKQTRTRTPDSVVWKGTSARNLTTSVRFSWDKYQNKLFENFLRNVGYNFKNSDITPLLVQLNLDGYENIKTKSGQNVHLIIEEKVQRKLRNTADKMPEEVMRVATFSPKQIVAKSMAENQTESIDVNLIRSTNHQPMKPRPVADLDYRSTNWPSIEYSTSEAVGSPSRSTSTAGASTNAVPQDASGSREKSTSHPHPLLKMPKPKSVPGRNDRTVVRAESPDPSRGTSRTTYEKAGTPPSSQPTIKSENSSQSYTSPNPRNPPRFPTAPPRSYNRVSNERPMKTTDRKFLVHLVSCLNTLRDSLDGVGACLDTSSTDGEKEWDDAVGDLVTAIHDMKIDVEILDELAVGRL